MIKPQRLVPVLLSALASPALAQGDVHLGGPPPGAEPLEVRVGFGLTNLTDVDEQQETISFDGHLVLTWRDPRLAHDPATVGAPGADPSDATRLPRKIYQGAFAVAELYPGWRPHVQLVNGIGDRTRTNQVLAVRPDGQVTYLESFQAVVETPMDLRRYPFDLHRLEVFMHPVGYGRGEIVLVPDAELVGVWDQNMGIADWRRGEVGVDERAIELRSDLGTSRAVSEVVLTLELERRPGHVLFTILLPLVLLVSLTWVVFWMDEESISARVGVSFTGILSVVAYYFVILDSVPEISYLTLMDAFIIATFLLLAAAVVVNVAVDKLNRSGRQARGDALDRVCRWAFPLGYALTAGALAGIFIA